MILILKNFQTLVTNFFFDLIVDRHVSIFLKKHEYITSLVLLFTGAVMCNLLTTNGFH